ncbi:unnamed protein product, partial [Didymodactylos carnosus]
LVQLLETFKLSLARYPFDLISSLIQHYCKNVKHLSYTSTANNSPCGTAHDWELLLKYLTKLEIFEFSVLTESDADAKTDFYKKWNIKCEKQVGSQTYHCYNTLSLPINYPTTSSIEMFA